MPARFDDSLRTIVVAVADVIDSDLSRHLGFANRGGFERLWVGQAIHSRYQDTALQRDATYQREVVTDVEFAHRGWLVKIRGRADGLRRDSDGRLVVEELKSIRPDMPPSPPVLELYERQARLYAWMLGQLREQEVGAELVLIPIGSFGDQFIERRPLTVDVVAIEASVRRRLSQLIAEHEQRAAARADRREAANRIKFPFHAPRPGQQDIVDAVERAIEQREHLLVEAATGLGKTAAALFPALRAALAGDLRVFVLTAKTTQQEMSSRVLDLLNVESSFRSLQLRSKAKMCANDEVLCHEDYCPYARDYFLKLSRTSIVDRLLETHPHLAPDAVFAAAKADQVCPFEVSLELGKETQALVCDYNYAFDPYVALTDFGPDQDLGNTVLVIDEIHNLVSRSRGYYSPNLSAHQASAVAEHVGAPGSSAGPLAAPIASLARRIAALITATVGSELTAEGILEGTFPEDDLWALRPEFDRAFLALLEHRRATKSFQAEDPFVGFYFDFLRFLNTLELARGHSAAFSHCLELTSAGAVLRILCKDASPFLARTINRCRSVIGLSATLSPFEFYRDLLGFEPGRTASIAVQNPFPRENRAMVIDATVSTTYKKRHENYLPIAQRLAEFAAAVPGNCLALFPSYSFLSEIADRLPELPNRRVLVQGRADTENQRQRILDTLRGALFGDVLLLAVAGGVFAEGVDYPGDALKAVAVIGPCLPMVSLEQKLLETYYQERFERGFEYAFVVPGMTRVVQAAGRLIRSAEDRGVIALFDSRFLQQPYRRQMPADWTQDGDLRSGHPATVAAVFFSGGSPARSEE